jgi:hypothetical protein
MHHVFKAQHARTAWRGVYMYDPGATIRRNVPNRIAKQEIFTRCNSFLSSSLASYHCGDFLFANREMLSVLDPVPRQGLGRRGRLHQPVLGVSLLIVASHEYRPGVRAGTQPPSSCVQGDMLTAWRGWDAYAAVR